MSEVQTNPNQVSFKLNGRAVTAEKGMTVMQVVKREGEKLPYFCWHPGLSVAGVCRFCMVEVVGRPKLEIGCNLQVAEGMEISTNSPKAKEAHKWALEFHLVNHPLDCPICDQAGECGLQDYYMEVGNYQSQMTRPKVLKPKALEVGGDLVLDTERCILCSRCVRFEDEITKTGALGIFDRGDRAVIGIYPGKKVEHQYTDNLVDICPVGAFTSKAFRFKQRVWFLKDREATCPGCSTGCQVKVYAKPEVRKFFRLKPRKSPVNKFWMCDKGRDTYKHLNRENRMVYAKFQGKALKTGEALAKLASTLRDLKAEEIGLLISAQYTVEEYQSLFALFVDQWGIKNIYQWREPTEDRAAFDGILLRGDQNPNTLGLLAELKKRSLADQVSDDFNKALSAKHKCLIAIAPERLDSFPSFSEHLQKLKSQPGLSLWGLHYSLDLEGAQGVIPLKGFAEKKGHFLNHNGEQGWLKAEFPSPAKEAVDIIELTHQLKKSYDERPGV